LRVKQLIHGGRLLTAGRLDGAPADVLIDGDTITAILPPGESVTSDAKRVDATGSLLIPGLVNSHTHATVAINKAMADRWSLELLLNAYPWTAGGRALEIKYLSARLGALEMLRKGCTACYDLAAEIPAPSVDGINAVARAYADVGIRAVIAPMMADTTFYRAIPGLIEAMPAGLREKAEALKATPYDVSLATCRTLIENWSFPRDQLRPALGMQNLIGQIAPGFKADMVFLDLNSINYMPLDEPLFHVVFVEDGTGVDRVMVGGRILVEGGKVLGVDMAKLAAEANAAAAHLTKANAAAKDFIEQFEPVVLDYCVGLAREPYHVQRGCERAH